MPAEPSATQAIVAAARAIATSRLGRARMPCRVVVTFDTSLELEGIAVELTALAMDPDSCITGCFRDVIATLARVGRRLTTMKLMSELEAAGLRWGETTVKTTLADAVKNELLDNRPQANPPGYGLPNWPAVMPAAAK